MKKILVFLAVMCLCAAIPSVNFTEDKSTVRLARTIYAIAGTEDYETQLAIGTVVMNRLESPWYPDTLEEVLSQQHQFPCGRKYDAQSLKAAHDVISGERVLDESAIAFEAKDAASPRGGEDMCGESGNYVFFSTERR